MHRQVYDCSFTFLLHPESCLQLRGQGAQACASVLATCLIDLATPHTAHNNKHTLTHTLTQTRARTLTDPPPTLIHKYISTAKSHSK